MKMFFQQMISLLVDEDGATMVEYSVVLVAIAVVCFLAVQSIGSSTNRMYDSASRPGVWGP